MAWSLSIDSTVQGKMIERPVLPPRLRRGDTIGLFCPAGPVRDVQRLRAGIKLIEDLGFMVKLRGPVEPQEGYLADTIASGRNTCTDCGVTTKSKPFWR